ncbi:MAG: nucleoside deaminase [Planctomycetota bacterium]
MEQHELFLKQAIDLAREKMLAGEGGPFGAVVVQDNQIVGRGWNQVTSTNDPTAHAEVVAVRDACERLGDFSLRGCQLYSSCEPCPMCLAAILWARLDAVWYAAGCTDAARAGFDDGHFYDEISRPIAKRKLPMRQSLRNEAVKVFEAWTQKEDRIEY